MNGERKMLKKLEILGFQGKKQGKTGIALCQHKYPPDLSKYFVDKSVDNVDNYY